MTKAYDETKVKNLSGLTAIRSKPEMYIGDLDMGVWTITREPADNVVDEALAERSSNCHIFMGKKVKDGIWVVDDGQGIPVGDIKVEDPVTHKTHTISALKAVVGLTHSGAKFDDKAYATSRGTHGVGIKATNALSTSFQVWTCYKGKWFSIVYAAGKEKKAVHKAKPPKLPNGKTPTKGTVVNFVPDESIFKKASVEKVLTLAVDWAKVTTYLLPGFKVRITQGSKTKEFYAKEGPKDYVKDRLAKLEATSLGKVFYVTTPLADVAVAFSDYDGQDLNFYVNGLRNVDEGTHANSTYLALHRALLPYAGKKQKFNVHDIKEGLLGIVNAKLSSPKFSSQTKEKLVDERAGEPLLALLEKAFTRFFKENKALARRVCERAAKLQELKGQFKASKKVLKELKTIRSQGMPSKFAGANRAKPEDRETYLVEGDSAGGTAKKARNPQFQEVLPLKGKIMNALKTKKDSEALESEEVLYILSAIGFVPEAKDPLGKLRTGKIICLSDPDPDGYHINSLILTLLFKFLPGLFDRGMVYIADAPEYYSQYDKGKKIAFGYSLEEVAKQVPKGSNVQHIKGWGEIDAEVLEPLAFDPKTRNLIRVLPVEKNGRVEFTKLMGDDVGYRKSMLGV